MKFKIFKKALATVMSVCIVLSMFTVIPNTVFAEITTDNTSWTVGFEPNGIYSMDYRGGKYSAVQFPNVGANNINADTNSEGYNVRYEISDDVSYEGNHSLRTLGNKIDASFVACDDNGDYIRLNDGESYMITLRYMVDSSEAASGKFGVIQSTKTSSWTNRKTLMNNVIISGKGVEGWKTASYIVTASATSETSNYLGFSFGSDTTSQLYIDSINVVSLGEIEPVTVSFESNGGSAVPSETGAPTTKLTGGLPTPVKDKFQFDGWFSDADFINEVTDENFPETDATYYAKWINSTYFCDFEDKLYREGEYGYSTSVTRYNSTFLQMNKAFNYVKYDSDKVFEGKYGVEYNYKEAEDYTKTSGITAYYFDKTGQLPSIKYISLEPGQSYEVRFKYFIEYSDEAGGQIGVYTGSNSCAMGDTTELQGTPINFNDKTIDGEWHEGVFTFVSSLAPNSSTDKYAIFGISGKAIVNIDDISITATKLDKQDFNVSFESYNDQPFTTMQVSDRFYPSKLQSVKGEYSLCYDFSVGSNKNETSYARAMLYDDHSFVRLISGSKYEVSFKYYVEETTKSSGNIIKFYTSSSGNTWSNPSEQKAYVYFNSSEKGKWLDAKITFTASTINDAANYLSIAICSNSKVYFDDLSVQLKDQTDKIQSSVILYDDDNRTVITGNVGEELSLPTPEKNDYVFLGWYSDKNYRAKTDREVFPANSTVLFARWGYENANSIVIPFEKFDESYIANSNSSNAFSITPSPTSVAVALVPSTKDPVNVEVVDNSLLYSNTTNSGSSGGINGSGEVELPAFGGWDISAFEFVELNDGSVNLEKGKTYDLSVDYSITRCANTARMGFFLRKADGSVVTLNVVANTNKTINDATKKITVTPQVDGKLIYGFYGNCDIAVDSINYRENDDAKNCLHFSGVNSYAPNMFVVPNGKFTVKETVGNDGEAASWWVYNEPYKLENGQLYTVSVKIKAVNNENSYSSFSAWALAGGTSVSDSIHLTKTANITNLSDGWQEIVLAFRADIPNNQDAVLAISFSGMSVNYVSDINVVRHDYQTSIVEFDTKDGSYVNPIVGIAGEKIDKFETSHKEGSSFYGWYSDTALGNEYNGANKLYGNNKIKYYYASFVQEKVNLDFEEGYPLSTVYGSYSPVRYELVADADKAYSGENFVKYDLREISGTVYTQLGFMLAESDTSKNEYRLADGVTYKISFKYNVVETLSKNPLYNAISIFAQQNYNANATSVVQNVKQVDIDNSYSETNGWVTANVTFTPNIYDDGFNSLCLKVSGQSLIYFDDFTIEVVEKGQSSVAFCTDGGDFPIQTGAVGSSFVAPNPIKEGYVFDGWYKDHEFTMPLGENNCFSKKGVTYFSKWVAAGGENSFEDTDTSDKNTVADGFVIDKENSASGSSSLKYTGATTQSGSKAMVLKGDGIILNNQTYIAYFYYKADAGSDVSISAGTSNGKSVDLNAVDYSYSVDCTAQDWTLTSVIFTTGDVGEDNSVYIKANGSGTVYVDDVTVVAAPKVNQNNYQNGSVFVDLENMLITVTPNDGYQLNAETFSIEYNYADFSATRKIFLKGDSKVLGQGSGLVYALTMPDKRYVQSITVSADFIPTSNENVAVLATSIRNSDISLNRSSALRFLGRIYLQDGKISVNGTTYDVDGYGYMVVPKIILDAYGVKDSDLSVENSGTVGAKVVESSGIVYDSTAQYIDIQAAVTGIDRMKDVDMTAKIYVKYTDNSGNVAYVYSEPMTRSFNGTKAMYNEYKSDTSVFGFEEYNQNMLGDDFEISLEANTGSQAIKYTSVGTSARILKLSNKDYFELKNGEKYTISLYYKSTGFTMMNVVATDINGNNSVNQGSALVTNVVATNGWKKATVSFTANVQNESNCYLALKIVSNKNVVTMIDDVVVSTKNSVHFETNGGSIIASAYGSVGSVVDLPKNPTYSNNEYTFNGWYTDEACTVKYNGTTVTIGNEDKTLYAGWTRNMYVEDFENYEHTSGTVSFNSDYELYMPTTDGFSKDNVYNGVRSIHRLGTTANAGTKYFTVLDQTDGQMIVGEKYAIGLWVMADQINTANDKIVISQFNGSNPADGTTSVIASIDQLPYKAGTWNYVEFSFTATAKYLALGSTASGNSLFFDGVKVLKDYELVWNDEFNTQNSADSTGGGLDTDVWNRLYATGEPAWVKLSDGSTRYVKHSRTSSKDNSFIITDELASSYNGVLDQYSDQYGSLIDESMYENGSDSSDNGFLVIKAMQVDKDGVSHNEKISTDDVYGYTSAKLNTNDKMNYTYGYIEINACLPYGTGIWPGFWPCGFRDFENPYNPELDIFESINSGLKIAANLHTWGSVDGQSYHINHLDGGINALTGKSYTKNYYFNYNSDGTANGGNSSLSSLYRKQFHTIGLEWTPERMNFYCDGNLYCEVDITSPEFAAFHQNVSVIVSMIVGSVQTTAPNSTTPWPAEFVIDYIRLYQRPGVGTYFNSAE